MIGNAVQIMEISLPLLSSLLQNNWRRSLINDACYTVGQIT